MRLLSELHLLFCTFDVTSAYMAVTSVQFLWFPQNEEKWIIGGKNHYKYAHVESCS